MAHAAGDSHEYPVHGYHFRVTFPLLDEDGDLVSGGASDTPDSEVSKDSGTFVDCTNEIAEIATSSGIYFLDLTGAEMTAKVVAVIIKVATATTQTTPIVLYPRRLPALETLRTAQGGADGSITLQSNSSSESEFYNGLFVGIRNDTPSGVDNQLRRITSYVGSTKIAFIDSNWGTNPSSSTTYDILIPEGYSTTSWGGIKIGGVENRGLTALPAKVVDMAGGLPISDAGGLDMDAILVDTTQIKADLPNLPTKNVALSNFPFLMIDSTDDVSPKTGLTVTGTISKDGGVFASLTNSVSEVGNGVYKVNLTATEMNVDTVMLRFTASGANDRFITILTQPT